MELTTMKSSEKYLQLEDSQSEEQILSNNSEEDYTEDESQEPEIIAPPTTPTPIMERNTYSAQFNVEAANMGINLVREVNTPLWIEEIMHNDNSTHLNYNNSNNNSRSPVILAGGVIDIGDIDLTSSSSSPDIVDC